MLWHDAHDLLISAEVPEQIVENVGQFKVNTDYCT